MLCKELKDHSTPGTLLVSSRLLLLALLACAGCTAALDIQQPRVRYQQVAVGTQPNSVVPRYSYESGIGYADRLFKAAIETLGVAGTRNDFNPPDTRFYYGQNCDKFYLNGESVTKCNGVVNLDESYSQLYRTDTHNSWGYLPYQILLISQTVVSAESGRLLGITTPRTDLPPGPMDGSFVFDSEIRLGMDDLVSNHCGYAEGGRPGYLRYIAVWAVAHELGRQIGGLHSPDDLCCWGQHNLNTLSNDVMSKMDPCDPINEKAHWFCKDTDPDTTNSCVDRLRNKFFPR